MSAVAFPSLPRTRVRRRRAIAMPPASMSGLSLIELMIAVVLGLLVVLAAIGLFTSNRAVYDSTEALSRIQENARAGFELMARDLRAADGTVCRTPVDTSTAAAAASPEKMPLIRRVGTGGLVWGDGLRGRINGSGDVIELRSATAGAVPIETHASNTFSYAGPPRFKNAESLLACDSNVGYLLSAIVIPSEGSKVSYATGTCEISPGGIIGSPAEAECDAAEGFHIDPVSRPAFLAPVSAVRWEVGTNTRGGRSLYRVALSTSSGEDRAEVIDGVRTLTLHYLLPGRSEYVPAAQVGDWKAVRAVRVALELEASPGGGAGNEKIGRRIVHVVSLRNRNP
jgi:type IV pilus assembly protein PilW